MGSQKTVNSELDTPAMWPVVVATPAHSKLAPTLSYLAPHDQVSPAPSAPLPLQAGTLVRVPLGSREVLGIVWDTPALTTPAPNNAPTALKPMTAVLQGIPPLGAAWRDLVGFAARYYQRAMGEVALAALPPQLRELDAAQITRRLKRKPASSQNTAAAPTVQAPTLHPQQLRALEDFFTGTNAAKPLPALLFGVTGSGKTEVYLHAAQRVLSRDPQAQVLLMVPEINLTPQLQSRVAERFAHETIATLHSGMTHPQRLQSWLLAHTGAARLVLGTRMSIFASMPGLRLIIVDEEHDPSYKSQDGARHSARDLAVMRAQLERAHSGVDCRVMLGSATPSLETWHACEQGRYQRLTLPNRAAGSQHATLRMADMRAHPRKTLFAPQLMAAIHERIARGEQSLIFLNRRGYAPVLACDACDWKSECSHCSAYRVFHKIDRTLRCHHCGWTERVPRACPECGNIDIQSLGRGTQKLEEELALALGLQGDNAPKRPDGLPIVIARMDADTTRLAGALEQQLAQVHSGEVDILVGTQMITKGHDFRRITLVAALDADAALFSADFRAPERLFALLMQAAGRAGRDAGAGTAQMWVQTRHPEHPLFKDLKAHDYTRFAAQQLSDRQQAGLPPFSHQALLRAEAKTQEIAQDFLHAAELAAQALSAREHITIYPPVPAALQRVANVERAQMLIESSSRGALQAFLSAWLDWLRAHKTKGLIRFALDVDPLSI